VWPAARSLGTREPRRSSGPLAARGAVLCLAWALAGPAGCGVGTPRRTPEEPVEWTHHVGGPEGARYSGLADIHRGNVRALTVAWAVRTFLSDPGSEWLMLEWRFEGGSMVNELDPGSLQNLDWGGPMVTSGTVRAKINVDGVEYLLEQPITVSPRNWSWSGSVDGRRATGGEIDACVGSYIGLTTGSSCTAALPTLLFSAWATGDGYDTDVVPGVGPNGQFHYVSDYNITMDLRSDINRLFRSDADTLNVPMAGHSTVVSACGPQRRNHFAVNTVCAPVAAYGNFLVYAWDHEDLHRNEGIAAAQASSGDLPSVWEGLLHASAAQLETLVEMRRSEVHEVIQVAMLCTHTGVNAHFDFWRNPGTGWDFSPITVVESRDPACP
jgi:hypothetical protein